MPTATHAMDRLQLDELYSLVYEELRRLARCILRSEHAAQITPTTLVNEAWLKLARSPEVAETSRLHFRRIAGRAMRQFLVDASRRRRARINGGDLVQVDFDFSLGLASAGHEPDILALDCALDLLARRSPRQAELVEAHFFGGFSFAECAEMLGVSEATVMREWRVARAWLACELRSAPRAPAEIPASVQPAG